jgi:hypothetical protein
MTIAHPVNPVGILIGYKEEFTSLILFKIHW